MTIQIYWMMTVLVIESKISFNH